MNYYFWSGHGHYLAAANKPKALVTLRLAKPLIQRICALFPRLLFFAALFFGEIHNCHAQTNDGYAAVYSLPKRGLILAGADSAQAATLLTPFAPVTDSSTYRLRLYVEKQNLFARHYYYSFQGGPKQPMFSSWDYSTDFKKLIHDNPEAEMHFLKAKYYGYGVQAGVLVTLIFSAAELIKTLGQVHDVNNGTIPDTGFKLSQLFVPLITAGFTVALSAEYKHHFRLGFASFNK